MNIPEYNTELGNNVVSNLNHIIPGNNESFPSAYDYLYDNADNTVLQSYDTRFHWLATSGHHSSAIVLENV